MDESEIEALATAARLQQETLAMLRRTGAGYDIQRRTADEYTRLYVAWHLAKYGRAPSRVPRIRIG